MEATMSELEFDPDGCVVDPATMDWSEQSDLSVIVSARSGTAEAIAEAKVRGLKI